ncbi:MAG: HNH endonuclease [Oligoflexus sp.]|nr:HNH endonuclease [Oligoflexus sp.]
MFQDPQVLAHELVERAKTIHGQERRITMESVRIVAELDAKSAWHYLGMSVDQLAFSIGLTPSQYYKRLKASKVMKQYPLAQEIFEQGESQISHIAMIAPHLSEANSEVLINGIRNKTKREVEDFMVRVNGSGQIIDYDPIIELTIRMTESQRSIFERVRQVLAHGGSTPTTLSALISASEAFLDKHDPMCKAERATQRQRMREKLKIKEVAGDEEDLEDAPQVANEEGEDYSAEELSDLTPLQRIKAQYRKKRRDPRSPVKASVRHRVWLRDGGQCTHVHGNGERCKQKSMLELDHLKMACHGGTNEEENLLLKCRRHNQFAAELALGKEFMEGKREGRG